jgi:hypothetical protein
MKPGQVKLTLLVLAKIPFYGYVETNIIIDQIFYLFKHEQLVRITVIPNVSEGGYSVEKKYPNGVETRKKMKKSSILSLWKDRIPSHVVEILEQ